MADYDLVEGFDSYNGNDAEVGFLSKWVQSGSSGYKTMQPGRYGGQCMQVTSPNNTEKPYVYRSMGFDSADFAFHMSVRHFSNNLPQITFGLGDASHIGIWLRDDGMIDIRRGAFYNGFESAGTQLAASEVGLVPQNTWHTLHGRINIHDSTGFVHIALDSPDNEVLALTGADTRNAGTGTCSTIRIGAQTGTVQVDDILIKQGSSVHIPERKIILRQVVSDGGILGLVPSTGSDHYAVVDGLTADETDYLSGTAVDDYDLLGVEDLIAPPAAFDGVQVVGYMGKTDSDSRAMTLGISSNSVEEDGPEQYLSTSIQRFDTYFGADPDTTTDWTYESFNALLLKPRVAV